MFVEVTPIAIENIYYKFYIILGVLNCCNAIVIWLFYPETARQSLEELDFYFAKKPGTEASEVPKDEKLDENMFIDSARREV